MASSKETSEKIGLRIVTGPAETELILALLDPSPPRIMVRTQEMTDPPHRRTRFSKADDSCFERERFVLFEVPADGKKKEKAHAAWYLSGRYRFAEEFGEDQPSKNDGTVSIPVFITGVNRREATKRQAYQFGFAGIVRDRDGCKSGDVTGVYSAQTRQGLIYVTPLQLVPYIKTARS